METLKYDELNLQRKLRMTLAPFFEMLNAKKDGGTVEEWTNSVRRLRTAIIRNPEQYFKDEYPDRKLLQKAIQHVFDEMVGPVDEN